MHQLDVIKLRIFIIKRIKTHRHSKKIQHGNHRPLKKLHINFSTIIHIQKRFQYSLHHKGIYNNLMIKFINYSSFFKKIIKYYKNILKTFLTMLKAEYLRFRSLYFLICLKGIHKHLSALHFNRMTLTASLCQYKTSRYSFCDVIW